MENAKIIIEKADSYEDFDKKFKRFCRVLKESLSVEVKTGQQFDGSDLRLRRAKSQKDLANLVFDSYGEERIEIAFNHQPEIDSLLSPEEVKILEAQELAEKEERDAKAKKAEQYAKSRSTANA